MERKENLPIVDNRLRRLAESQFTEVIDRFLMGSARLEYFRSLDAPPVIISRQEEMIRSYSRRIDFFSKFCGLDSSTVVQERIEKILSEFNRGIFHPGTYLVSFRRKDRDALEEMLQKLHEGRLHFEQSGEEERQKFEELQKSLKEIPNLVNKFWLSSEGEWEEGWHEVGSWVKVDYHEYEQTLGVVLRAGRKITVEVSDWDEEVFPRQREREAPKELQGTFPVFNAVFYYKEDEPQHVTERVITCLEDVEALEHKLSSYTLNKLISNSFQKHLDPSMQKKLKKIIERDIGIDARKLKKIQIAWLLRSIMEFINKKGSGEDVVDFNERDIEQIIHQYEKDGCFPGTCKATATLMAGFCEALGLPARTLDGSVLSLEEGSIGGHAWTEVYIPVIRTWVPVDPGMGTFLTYPSEEMIYLLDGSIYPKKDREIKIKVTYQDNKS